VTESRKSRPAPAAATAPKRAAATAPKRAAATAPKRAAAPRAKTVVVAASSLPPAPPAARHPNLGLAPFDMTSSFPAAAGTVRDRAAGISAAALKAAQAADPTIAQRHDEAGLETLLRDGELLTERLAMCLGGGRDGWLTEYAEWIGPIERRRGVPLADLAAICDGIREAIAPHLAADELAAATASLDAAAGVFRRNGRVGGDRHKRNAFLKWFYRGV
jgi:hypothetical protein